MNNMEVKTNTLILTFNSPKIPESLKNVISVKDLAMLPASASTAKPVPNARQLATRMNLVQRHLNA